MGQAFAEAIGEAGTFAPMLVLMTHWLAQLGLSGEVREVSIEVGALSTFLAERQSEPDWRGCIATAPHRQRLATMVSVADPRTRAIGAIQCVIPEAGGLIGVNLDLAGIEEALDRLDLEGGRTAIIGTGCLARATIAYLETRSLDQITVLARSGNAAHALAELAPGTYLEVVPPELADDHLAAANLIVNTSPLGTTSVPIKLLDALARHTSGKVLFDTNTASADPVILKVGRAHGARVIDGITLTLGKARLCFELFFGCPAPSADLIARDLLQRELQNGV